MVSELDILIVKRPSTSEKAYEFLVCKSLLMTTLEYKLINDPYYKDVQLNSSVINTFPYQPTNISSIFRSVTTSSTKPDELVIDSNYDLNLILTPLDIQPSSFVPNLQN